MMERQNLLRKTVLFYNLQNAFCVSGIYLIILCDLFIYSRLSFPILWVTGGLAALFLVAWNGTVDLYNEYVDVFYEGRIDNYGQGWLLGVGE